LSPAPKSRSIGRRAALGVALGAALLPVLGRPARAAELRLAGSGEVEQQTLAALSRELLLARGHELAVDLGAGKGPMPKALTDGAADIAWCYAEGAYPETPPPATADPVERYRQAKFEGALQGLVWLTPATIDNRHALVLNLDMAGARCLHSLGDLANRMQLGDRLTLAVSDACLDRGCLEPIEQTYGLAFEPERIRPMSDDLAFQALAERKVDLVLARTTDGRILAQDLEVLADRRNAFTADWPTAVIRGDVLRRHPDLQTHFRLLSDLLNLETLQHLNYRLVAESMPADAVAREFLEQAGVI
jgi:osmoprotectant transport system substrate-binding protein